MALDVCNYSLIWYFQGGCWPPLTLFRLAIYEASICEVIIRVEAPWSGVGAESKYCTRQQDLDY